MYCRVLVPLLFSCFLGSTALADVARDAYWAEPETVEKHWQGITAQENGDFDEAAELYREAADDGFAPAQVDLGNLYYRGDGVSQDYRKAATWYRKAAEQGHGQAQLYIGALYQEGNGVTQHYGEAAEWYRKAAQQGVPQACIELAHMYMSGTGVPVDPVQAHKWVNIAGTLGLEEVPEVRQAIADAMTEDQIVEAQRLAKAWLEQNDK